MLVSSSVILMVICAIRLVCSHQPDYYTASQGETELDRHKTYAEDYDYNSTWFQGIEDEIKSLDCGRHGSMQTRERFPSREGSDEHTPLVAGGYYARPGEFPSFVGIGSDRGANLKDKLCGGAIVHPRVILTAAHCLVGSKGIIVGASIKNPLRWTKDDKMYVPHTACMARGFDPNPKAAIRHDFAVLILEKGIVFDENIQPACLPRRPVRKGGFAIAVGNGKTESGQTSASLKALLVKESTCPKDTPAEFVCFTPRKGGGDTCHGDSGGPVYAIRGDKQYLVGITSYGPEECSLSVPGLGKYLDTQRERYSLFRRIDECNRM